MAWSNRLRIGFCVLFMTAVCMAQQPPPSLEVKLLDRLAGDWVMQGTIGKQQTTHDLHADWVLNREYLRLHEVSREKNASGGPAYEAIIFMSWDPKAQEYVCLWLDNTEGGGLSAEGLAHGKKAGDSIPLIFGASSSDSIHTTFAYHPGAGTWELNIDNVSNGKIAPFARLKLERKQ